MDFEKVNLDLLFETSWEVCNKVGGIYTVLSTKAKTLQQLYRGKVIFIGPDLLGDDKYPADFIPDCPTSLRRWAQRPELPDGLAVKIGRWDVPGRPIAILVRFQSLYFRKDSLYGKMWDLYGVDSLHAYGDYDESCMFAVASAIVIESICNHLDPKHEKNIIAHFDEWTTAMGLLYLKWKCPRIATIFTTHATCIGRSICGNGKPLYDYMPGYNGDQMSRELNMESKHSLEKAGAAQADCFTTVSDVTATECCQLLEKCPDVVTPNGFESDFVPLPRRFSAVRAAARKSLLNVAESLTGKAFSDNTFIVATAGRPEWRNKGIDMFIDSMERLADMMPEGRRLLVYLTVPGWCREARADLQRRLQLKRLAPLERPFVTHEINNPDSDPIYQRVAAIDTRGRFDIIYAPSYLQGNDGIFNLSYYNLLIGFDATVFPSYYEPWGYTPLESIAFGVPTVTTSLSGFGRWILANFDNDIAATGVKVIDRNDRNYGDCVNGIADSVARLAAMTPEQIKNAGKAAKATARKAEWNVFADSYLKAFEIALRNEQNRNN